MEKLRIGTGLPGPGRPSIYSEELATLVCDLIAHGKSLYDIEKIEGLPSRFTIWSWQQSNPVFKAMYAQAREQSAESFENEVLDIGRAAETKEQAYVASVRFDTLKWVASYGEKVTQDVRFSGTLTVEHDVSDRGALLVELQRKLGIEAAAPALIEGVAEPGDDTASE